MNYESQKAETIVSAFLILIGYKLRKADVAS